MQPYLSLVHTGMRYGHISLGFVGLVLFWWVVVMRKGTAWHRRIGMLFAFCAWIVGGTGLISSLWALLHFASFTPWLQQIPAGQREAVVQQYQFLFSILLFLSAATVSGATFGVFVIRYRKQHQVLRRSLVPALQLVVMISAMYLLGFGAYQYMNYADDGNSRGLPRGVYWIPIILAAIGIPGIVGELRYVFGPGAGPKEALCRHIEQMGGTGIAFHTAFLVFGSNRLFEFQLPGAWQIFPWVLPSIVGGIWIHFIIRSIRRSTRTPLAQMAEFSPAIESSMSPR